MTAWKDATIFRKLTLGTEYDPALKAITAQRRVTGPARDLQNEFWQQAEALVGLLDAYILFRDEQYWTAFRLVWDFVWKHNINHAVGEWYALLERDGTVKWDYLGHAWKNNYHTVRSMIKCIRRLKQVE